MATVLPKFELVDAKEMPKQTKVMSAEEKAFVEGIQKMLTDLKPGQAAKFPLDGENTARTIGIKLGHIINGMELKGEFETSNDGNFYFITRKNKKGAATVNGVKPNAEPVAV